MENITEDLFQAELWQWVWNNLPETRLLLFAIPNGGKRDWATAKMLQATGTTPGPWDLILFWAGAYYHFELKVGRNGLTKPQELWRDRMISAGADPTKFIVISEAHGGREIFKATMIRIVRGQNELKPGL